MLVSTNMILFRILGGILVAIGGIGLFLPVWPTTIFWILAALCFARSSPKARDWIYAQPGVGGIVESFVERGTLSRRSKIAATTGMLLAGLISCLLLYGRWPILAATFAGLAVGIAFVWTRASE